LRRDGCGRRFVIGGFESVEGHARLIGTRGIRLRRGPGGRLRSSFRATSTACPIAMASVRPRGSMNAKPSENEKPKPIARAHERSWPVACRGGTRHCDASLRSRPGVQWHERKTTPTWRAYSAKKSSRADDPAPKTPTQRYAYASKLLGDRDGGDFAPACSSQDLDCVGRRRCSPLGPAGGTLAHPAWFVIKVKTSRKPVKSLAGGYGAAWPQQRR